jgi:tetratricopeptide (TPR) repeat protein
MTAIQKLIAIIAALVLIGGGAYYFSTRAQAPTTSGIATTTPNGAATSTQDNTTTPGQANSTVATPDASKPIAFSADISADIRTQLNVALKNAQAEIAKNPLSPGPWITLGNIHKIGGDYANAALYWEYVAGAYRGKAVPYLSLGDLYENFLKDTTKAETYYKLAIQNDPANVNAYANLYTMYHFTLKNDTKAAAILADGLKANPDNTYLLGLQQELN